MICYGQVLSGTQKLGLGILKIDGRCKFRCLEETSAVGVHLDAFKDAQGSQGAV